MRDDEIAWSTGLNVAALARYAAASKLPEIATARVHA